MAKRPLLDEEQDDTSIERTSTLSYTASLISQGRHRFYTLTMPSDVLARCCTVEPRIENSLDGFQRTLDSKRADEIAKYIDEGFGTIPGSIVLSAQARAHFTYTRTRKTVTFHDVPGAFLILDGQHRVYGFAKAQSQLRVPVVIYNELGRSDEARLFIDINTKQRPVPNELLLDIKQLAETESDSEAFLREVFDKFNDEPTSPLQGLLSASARARGKLSRVTFYAAVRSAWTAFAGSSPDHAYEVLSAYIQAWVSGLRKFGATDNLTNPTLFRAMIFLFPDVAQRVADRYGEEFSAENFQIVLKNFFAQVRKQDLLRPGNSHIALHETFRRALRQQFSISQ